MRFVCQSCQAKYSIADERVQNRVIKLRCQKCNAEITIKGPTTGAAASPEARPAGMRTLASIEPISRSTDSGRMPPMAQPAAAEADDFDGGPRDATKIASLSELENIRRQAMLDASEPKKPVMPPPPPPRDNREWFVLIGGQQEGPASESELRARAKKGEVTARTYAWREGMGEWQRLSAIAELKTVAAEAPAIAAGPRDAAKALSVAELVDAGLRTPGPGGRAAPPPAKGKAQFDDLFADAGAESEAEMVSDAQMVGGDQGPPASPLSALTGAGAAANDTAEKKSEPIISLGAGGSDADAPPREATRMFIAAAGLVERKKRQRVYAIAAGAVFATLLAVIGLDLAGVIAIPALGAAYTAIGIENPHQNAGPGQFSDNLTDEERRKIREGLMGRKPDEVKPAQPRPAGDKPAAPAVDPFAAAAKSGATEQKMLSDVYGDTQKTAVKIEPPKIKTPEQDLPQGIGPEAIGQVVSSNQKAVKFCLERALKKGQQLGGKMEVEFTIQATGTVAGVDIKTAKFKGTEFGDCVISSIKTWKFPRFSGDAVSVEYPFILSSGM